MTLERKVIAGFCVPLALVFSAATAYFAPEVLEGIAEFKESYAAGASYTTVMVTETALFGAFTIASAGFAIKELIGDPIKSLIQSYKKKQSKNPVDLVCEIDHTF